MNWISVKERLPENGDYVLCYCNERVFQPTNIVVTQFGKYGFVGNSTVTHWMPLPEPPKK